MELSDRFNEMCDNILSLVIVPCERCSCEIQANKDDKYPLCWGCGHNWEAEANINAIG